MPVVEHAKLKEFEMMGNFMTGLATPRHGAQTLEVWQAGMAPGASTPLHRHDAEEIILVLRGQGEAHAAGEVDRFHAPCTLILPGNQLHQLKNTGAERRETIAVVPIGSKVFEAEGNEMALPWRE